VIVKEETYRRLAKAVEVESVDPSFFEYGEFTPSRNEMKILDRLLTTTGRRP
jgi:hypothetical protein